MIIGFNSIIVAQSAVDYLKMVENGQAERVRAQLPNLLKEHPNDASFLFLDAVLTEAGDEAVEKYKAILKKYPNSNFADASLYRIFSYYFALGYYKTAEDYLAKLKNDYPASPYLKVADRTIPEEELDQQLKLQPPKKEEKKSAVNEVKSIEGKFTIQAGAFLNYKNAERLKNNFIKSGYYSTTYPKEVGGSILNVVIVGKFNSEAEAKNFLPKLKKEYKLNGRVIPLK